GQRSFVAIIAGCGVLFAAGVAAGVYGRSRPVFTVSFETAQKALIDWCTEEGQVVDAAGDRYLALFGDHYLWTDAGVGLIAVGFAIAAIALLLRFHHPDEQWVLTPASRLLFLC